MRETSVSFGQISQASLNALFNTALLNISFKLIEYKYINEPSMNHSFLGYVSSHTKFIPIAIIFEYIKIAIVCLFSSAAFTTSTIGIKA